MTTTSQSTKPSNSNFFTIKPFLILVVAVIVLGGGFFGFKALLDNTTLTFSFNLDGKPIPVGSTPVVKVDGQVFTSGCTITPGPHQLSVDLQIAEPFIRKVWAFWGDKNLGALPLESSKGTLLVSVNPSPARVVVRRGIEVLVNGDSPLTIEKLALGDYELEIKRGEYTETHTVKIQGRQRTEAKIDLNLGAVQLFSEPADAEYELSGNGRKWNGKLPARIDDVQGGTYEFTARRKDWGINTMVSVSRGAVETNKVKFAYGAIEVTSEPSGVVIFTNSIEVGKTPITLKEVKPGTYQMTASDGVNDLTADVNVGINKTTQQVFSFHYAEMKINSIPAGATIIRKGSAVGRTPFSFNRIPIGITKVTLKLDGYMTTNVVLVVAEGDVANLTIKMFSERYIQAMKDARMAFDSERYPEAQKFLAAALESEPNDPAAVKFTNDVSQASMEVEKAKRKKIADAKAIELASLNQLDFQSVISDCTDTRVVQNPVVMNDGYYDQKGKFIITGQHTEIQNNTITTFNEARYADKYMGKLYKYDSAGWKIAKIEKDGSIAFRGGSGKVLQFGQVEIKAKPSKGSEEAFLALKKDQHVIIKARIGQHDQGDLWSRVLNRIFLEDAEIVGQ